MFDKAIATLLAEIEVLSHADCDQAFFSKRITKCRMDIKATINRLLVVVEKLDESWYGLACNRAICLDRFRQTRRSPLTSSKMSK